MNEWEQIILPRMSADEHSLYRQRFGDGAVPPRLKPARCEWPEAVPFSWETVLMRRRREANRMWRRKQKLRLANARAA